MLARMVSLDGSGDEVKPGEGACLQQADVSAITCKVYDLGTDKDAATGTEITPAPTLVVATNVYDALRTTGWPVAIDPHGYNFRHDVGVAYVPSPNNWYQIEYKFTLAVGGGVAWLRGKVKTKPVIQS